MSEIRSLENSELILEVSDAGAELSRIYDKKKKREVLWNADAKYWGRHAPLLFPFVGKLNGGVYHYEGKEYAMSAHGFARDSEFTLVEQDDTAMTHCLKASEATKKNYPFDFELFVTHRLSGNRIRVEWTVKNTDTKTLYYSIGGHPAFFVDDVMGCRLLFEGKERLSCTGIDLANGTADAEHPVTLALSDQIYTIDAHSFDADTMIFDGGQVKKVTLLEADGTKRVTLLCPEARQVGIWSPVGKGAPFLCLEPWIGRCDNKGFRGELKDKYGEQSLEAGKTFETAYEIIVEE